MPRTLPTVALLALAVGAAPPLQAQTGLGVGLRVAQPRGDFEERVDGRGYGVVGVSAVTGQSVWLTLTTGWTRFRGPEVEGTDEAGEAVVVREKIDSYELMLGYGLSFGPIRVGVRGGRFFGDGASWGYMPVAGFGFGPLIVEGEWDPRGEVQWWGVSGSLVR